MTVATSKFRVLFHSALLGGILKIGVALVFEQRGMRFLMPVKQHPDGPRPGVNLGIVQSCLIGEDVGFGAGDVLDDVQCVTVEVSRLVQPGVRKIIRRVDHQGVAFPVPA